MSTNNPESPRNQSNQSLSPPSKQIIKVSSVLSLSPNPKISENYAEQQHRIQITSNWKEYSISKEQYESSKLERFIIEERHRAHHVAQNLQIKQQEAEARRENLAIMKAKQREEIKQRNIEQANKVGNKAEEMKMGDMARYEQK